VGAVRALIVTPGVAYAIWVVLACMAAGLVSARHRGRTWWQPAALAALCVASTVAFAVLNWGRATPFGDFNKAYYAAGLFAVTDPSRLYECAAGNLCFVNIPIVALLFSPLAALPLEAARLIFTLAGALAVVVFTGGLVRALRLSGAAVYALIAIVALNGPLLYSARLGNVTHVMLPLLLFGILCLVRGYERSGGIVLALIAVLKPPFLLFGVYLVARARWRAAIFYGLTIAVTFVLSLAVFGADLHAEWLRDLGRFSRWPVGAYNAQSVVSALARAIHPYNLINWEPLVVAPWFDVVRQIAVLALVSVPAVVVSRTGIPRTGSARWHELNIVLVLTLLVAPITWTHYYAFCLIPLSGYVTTFVGAAPIGRLRHLTLLALLAAPAVLALPEHAIVRALHERVIVSHYVWGGLVLLTAIVFSRVQGFEVFETAVRDDNDLIAAEAFSREARCDQDVLSHSRPGACRDRGGPVAGNSVS
jgi:glycosyl transferase family 87